jgi:mono/diheme cytochrome c family protein
VLVNVISGRSIVLLATLTLLGCVDGVTDEATASVSETEVDPTSTDPTSTNESSGEAPSVEFGAQVYSFNCAACHGASGEGGTGPAMASTVPGMSAADVESVVRNGIGTMPGYGSILSNLQISSVVLYVLDTFGE